MGINVALTWAVILYAVFMAQPTVAVAGLTIIATLLGTYVGIGHLDLRSMLNAMKGGMDFGGGTMFNNPTDTSGQDQ